MTDDRFVITLNELDREIAKLALFVHQLAGPWNDQQADQMLDLAIRLRSGQLILTRFQLRVLRDGLVHLLDDQDALHQDARIKRIVEKTDAEIVWPSELDIHVLHLAKSLSEKIVHEGNPA